MDIGCFTIVRKQHVRKHEILNTHYIYQILMIHKIKYFESKQLASGVYLQDVVNDFLAKHSENIIAVLPVMDNALLVHYTE